MYSPEQYFPHSNLTVNYNVTSKNTRKYMTTGFLSISATAYLMTLCTDYNFVLVGCRKFNKMSKHLNADYVCGHFSLGQVKYRVPDLLNDTISTAEIYWCRIILTEGHF
jgi:hypothetical protein